MELFKKKNLYQITYRSIRFPMNCFIVEQENDLIAIDVGAEEFVQVFADIVEKTGKNISKLLLTHAHDDHADGLLAFKEAFPEALVGISKRGLPILMGDLSLQEGESPNKICGNFPKFTFEADFTFEDMEEIDSLIAVSTPGHTPGSFSFYIPEEEFLIVGDAFQITGGMAVAGDRRKAFPLPALSTWDLQLSLESAQKLFNFKPKLLVCGHGNMLERPGSKMFDAIKRLEKKLADK